MIRVYEMRDIVVKMKQQQHALFRFILRCTGSEAQPYKCSIICNSEAKTELSLMSIAIQSSGIGTKADSQAKKALFLLVRKGSQNISKAKGTFLIVPAGTKGLREVRTVRYEFELVWSLRHYLHPSLAMDRTRKRTSSSLRAVDDLGLGF
nr:hypothetical protein CFP56_03219 [Quercus suber]